MWGTFGAGRRPALCFHTSFQQGHQIDDLASDRFRVLLVGLGHDLGLSRFDPFVDQLHEIFVIRVPITLRFPRFRHFIHERLGHLDFCGKSSIALEVSLGRDADRLSGPETSFPDGRINSKS